MLEFKVQRDLLWQRLINSSKRHLISTEDHVTSYLLMFSFQFMSAFFSLFVTTAEAPQRDGGYTFTPQYVCFTGKQLLSSVCRQNLTFLSLADDCSINAQMKRAAVEQPRIKSMDSLWWLSIVSIGMVLYCCEGRETFKKHQSEAK